MGLIVVACVEGDLQQVPLRPAAQGSQSGLETDDSAVGLGTDADRFAEDPQQLARAAVRNLSKSCGGDLAPAGGYGFESLVQSRVGPSPQ